MGCQTNCGIMCCDKSPPDEWGGTVLEAILRCCPVNSVCPLKIHPTSLSLDRASLHIHIYKCCKFFAKEIFDTIISYLFIFHVLM
jgi:hypothetical protein